MSADHFELTGPIILFDQDGYVSYFGNYADLVREATDEPLILDEATAIFDGEARPLIARTGQRGEVELSVSDGESPRLDELRRRMAHACRVDGRASNFNPDLGLKELLKIAKDLDEPRPWRPWRRHKG